MTEPFRTLPRSVQAYIIVLAVILVVGLVLFMPIVRPFAWLGVVLIFAAICGIEPVQNPRGGSNYPILSLQIVVALLFQPGEVLLGIGLGTWLGEIVVRRKELWRATANSAFFALPTFAAAELAGVLRDTIPPYESLIAAGILAVVTIRIMNMGLFSFYRSQRFHYQFLMDWGRLVVTNWESQLLSAPLAILLSALAINMPPLWTPLAFTALTALGLPIARQELVSYYRSQAMVDQIVDSVVGALERMHPGALAHSKRVSELAVATGHRLGMLRRTLVALELASRLHDLGMLAGGSTGRTAQEDAAAAARVLGDLHDPLIAAMVRAHHDRWDMMAPMERSRRSDVVGAQIISAAEAYDHARAGTEPFNAPQTHEDAAAYLRSLAGTALDPAVVLLLLEIAANQDFGGAVAG